MNNAIIMIMILNSHFYPLLNSGATDLGIDFQVKTTKTVHLIYAK